MIRLSQSRLQQLRDKLRAHGQRPSLFMSAAAASRTTQELLDTKQIVQEWSSFCEAMYLMMAADRRVLNVEREVLRGALAVLAGDNVRTRHMESMMDAASRKLAEEGPEKRLRHVIEDLRNDRARAETTVVLAAAIAAADQRIVPEEHELLQKLLTGLEIDEARANELLAELDEGLAARQPPEE
jgi:tellurite resistance protein